MIIQLNKIKRIVVRLVIAGLILDKKNFLLEFKAPKLKPMNPDKGIQGVSIINFSDIDLFEFKYIN